MNMTNCACLPVFSLGLLLSGPAGAQPEADADASAREVPDSVTEVRTIESATTSDVLEHELASKEPSPPTAVPVEEVPVEEVPVEEVPVGKASVAQIPIAVASVDEQGPVGAPEEVGQTIATTGWFRMDYDWLGPQFWAGATHTLGGLAFATDIYIAPSRPGSDLFAQFDIGVEIPWGPFLLIPMAGIGVDWGEKNLSSLIAPQIFTYGDLGPIYLEWWSQFYLGNTIATDRSNDWYNRLFLLYNMSDEVAIGPQVEVWLNTQGQGVTSLPVGGHLLLGYGKNNTLGLFFGYETQNESHVGGKSLAGRFTFVRSW